MKTINSMLISLVMVVMLVFSSTINSQPCYYLWWDSTYTGSGAAQDSAVALALDNTGNFLYVTGWSISGSYSNIVTIKYDVVTGNRIWISSYNFAGFTDRPTCMAVDMSSGDLYVAGYSYINNVSNRDYVTIKYNPANGDTVWTKRYNGPVNGGDEIYAMAIDNSGNVFVTGNSDQGLTTSADVVTIKYNSSGASSLNILNMTNVQKPNAIKINNAGDVFIAGYSRTGNDPFPDDYLTVKYDNNLNFQWSKTYNGTANNVDVATGITADVSGNSYVTGFSYWTGQLYNYVTIKYNSGGDSINGASYNGVLNNNDVPTAIGIDNSGNIYVTGYSLAAISPGFYYDYATLQYNSSLQQQWIKGYNGNASGDDRATALAIDGSSNIYITGFSRGTSGAYDFLTLKYTSSGSPLCTLRQNVQNLNAFPTGIVVNNIQTFFVTGSVNMSGSGLDYLTIRNSLDPIGVKPISSEVPLNFMLYQNYPNPFNPATKIRFDLPSALEVKLAVYDVSGKELFTLAEEMLKPGIYEYVWDASDYSSGIYFCRLIAGDYAQTRKMMLIK